MNKRFKYVIIKAWIIRRACFAAGLAATKIVTGEGAGAGLGNWAGAGVGPGRMMSR